MERGFVIPKAAYCACSGGCRAGSSCSFGCVGCGVCVSVCPQEAVSLNAFGVAEVDAARCAGCGRCAEECPRGVLHLHEKGSPMAVVCSSEDAPKVKRGYCAVSCIGCGLCARSCPAGAIRVAQNLARMEESLCLSCGVCAVSCPRGAIRDLRGLLTP